MLSRNEFIYSPTTEVDTTEAEKGLFEIYVNDMQVRIYYLTIYTYQRDDQELLDNRTNPGTSSNYVMKKFGRYYLWNKRSATDNKLRIWIPKDLRSELLQWYHEMLFHPGARRLEDSVRSNFTCPGLSKL